ncbi:MAG: molybdenum cofactor biosynthesis protein MoaE, partial [Candidatus Korarchaeota archaeon]|nr:molybdenum cofactor biosynthesis protein MoaE [Candidatus Korarchaeota archaeon]
VIRETSPHGRVKFLYYDFYPEMAGRALEEIRRKAVEKFGLVDATILHRVGEVPVGETALLVITASEHREAAFEAARWMVDEVKRSAAIWKKEVFIGGEERWVEEG